MSESPTSEHPIQPPPPPPPGAPAHVSLPPPSGQPYGQISYELAPLPDRYPPAPTYYYPPGNPYGAPRDHPQAGLAFGLGLGGLFGGIFTCGLAFALGPFAWFFGHKARTEIRRNPGAYHPEGNNATIGMILGIGSSALFVLAMLIWILIIIGALANSDDSSGTSALTSLLL